MPNPVIFRARPVRRVDFDQLYSIFSIYKNQHNKTLGYFLTTIEIIVKKLFSNPYQNKPRKDWKGKNPKTFYTSSSDEHASILDPSNIDV